MSTRRGSQHWSTASIGEGSEGSVGGASIDSDFWDRQPGDVDWGTDEVTTAENQQQAPNDNDRTPEPSTHKPTGELDSKEQAQTVNSSKDSPSVQIRPVFKSDSRRASAVSDTGDGKKQDGVPSKQPSEENKLEQNKYDQLPPEDKEIEKENSISKKTSENREHTASNKLEQRKDDQLPQEDKEIERENLVSKEASENRERIASNDIITKSEISKDVEHRHDDSEPKADKSLEEKDDTAQQNSSPKSMDSTEATMSTTETALANSYEATKSASVDDSVTSQQSLDKSQTKMDDISREEPVNHEDADRADGDGSTNNAEHVSSVTYEPEPPSSKPEPGNQQSDVADSGTKEDAEHNSDAVRGSSDTKDDSGKFETDESNVSSQTKMRNTNGKEKTDSEVTDKNSSVSSKSRGRHPRRPSSSSTQGKAGPNKAKPPIPKPRSSRRPSKEKKASDRTENGGRRGSGKDRDESPRSSLKHTPRRTSMELYGSSGKQLPKKRVKFEDEMETALVQEEDKTQQWVDYHFQGPLIDLTDGINDTPIVGQGDFAYTDPPLEVTSTESSTVEYLYKENEPEREPVVCGDNTDKETQTDLASLPVNHMHYNRNEGGADGTQGHIANDANVHKSWDMRDRTTSPLIYYVGQAPWWANDAPFSPSRRRTKPSKKVIETPIQPTPPVTAKPPTPPPGHITVLGSYNRERKIVKRETDGNQPVFKTVLGTRKGFHKTQRYTDENFEVTYLGKNKHQRPPTFPKHVAFEGPPPIVLGAYNRLSKEGVPGTSGLSHHGGASHPGRHTFTQKIMYAPRKERPSSWSHEESRLSPLHSAPRKRPSSCERPVSSWVIHFPAPRGSSFVA